MTKLATSLTWMIKRDLPEVLAIEHATDPCPWTEKATIDALQQRNIIGMCSHDKNRVVGFMVYELCPSFIRVLRFAVDPFAQRMGVGTAMLAKLKGKLSPGKRNVLRFDVRESNLGAQLFLREGGLRAVKIVGEHFKDNLEAAYRFEFACGAQEPTKFLASVSDLTSGWA